MIGLFLSAHGEAEWQTWQPGDEIIGTYWTETKEGKIEIFREGEHYFGKILWRKDARKDIHHPDPN
ncbi:MAG: hypothetical protein AAF206_07755, partial [Bacteroidota bacterium]